MANYISKLSLTSSHKFPIIFLKQNSPKTNRKVWFSAFKCMVAWMIQLQTIWFQRILFTAGLRSVTSDNLYTVVESSRLKRKQNDLCCLRVKRPPVHHIWWRLHTDLLLLNVKQEKRKYRFLVFTMYLFLNYDLLSLYAGIATIPWIQSYEEKE